MAILDKCVEYGALLHTKRLLVTASHSLTYVRLREKLTTLSSAIQLDQTLLAVNGEM